MTDFGDTVTWTEDSMTGNRHMFSSADNDIVGHIPEQPTQSNIELIVLVGLQFSCED